MWLGGKLLSVYCKSLTRAKKCECVETHPQKLSAMRGDICTSCTVFENDFVLFFNHVYLRVQVL